MTKEMNVHCDFLTNSLTCTLPEHMMDVMLKVRKRSGDTYIQGRCIYKDIEIREMV